MVGQIVPQGLGLPDEMDDQIVSRGEWEFPEDLQHDYSTEEDRICCMSLFLVLGILQVNMVAWWVEISL